MNNSMATKSTEKKAQRFDYAPIVFLTKPSVK